MSCCPLVALLPCLTLYRARPWRKPLGTTLSAAKKNRGKLSLATAPPSICLSKVARRSTSTCIEALIFPSPTTGTVDKHLDRVIHAVIDKANRVGCAIKTPRMLCHAFRAIYATRRHQNGVDIETLRQELGHSDIATTQIYLHSADRKSARHRARINEADTFSLAPRSAAFLLRVAS